jgi:hypothetical protein
MNSTVKLRFAFFILAGSVGAALAVACSSSDSVEPAPTIQDSGPDGKSSTTASSSGSGSGGNSSTSSSGGTSSSSSGGSADGGDAAPSNCTPDASANCNSCATVSTDPYNTCSAFTVNCLKFATTVPSYPPL